LKVKHKKGTDINAENLRGAVNRAPIGLSGKILGIGTPDLLIDVDASARQLDLAHLRELFPGLKQLGLEGTVDMDLDIYIPYAAARNSRLKGMLATRNLGFHSAHVTVEQGDSEFALAGNSAVIKKAQVRINESSLAVTGKIANPVEPDIQLHVISPDLNVDRLLPPGAGEISGSKPSQEQDSRASEEAARMPPFALRTTGALQLEAEKARYKGVEFEKLRLNAAYDRGVIKQGDLSFGLEAGQVALTGSGDIRDPEHVSFTVSPDIKSVPLERLAAVLDVHDASVSGPISASGRLQGRTGSSKEILSSLQGNLDAQMGPGTIAQIGRGGEIFARIFSLTSARGILTASVLEDFAGKGLPYRNIIWQTTLNGGNMDVTRWRFESDAMNIDAKGRINLLEEQMDVGVRLKPLGAVSTVVGAVPVVGKVAASLTEVYLNLSGSLDDPRVSYIPGKGIADSIEDQAKGVTGFFGREESKWVKK
jgi:AsmA protein